MSATTGGPSPPSSGGPPGGVPPAPPSAIPEGPRRPVVAPKRAAQAAARAAASNDNRQGQAPSNDNGQGAAEGNPRIVQGRAPGQSLQMGDALKLLSARRRAPPGGQGQPAPPAANANGAANGAAAPHQAPAAATPAAAPAPAAEGDDPFAGMLAQARGQPAPAAQEAGQGAPPAPATAGTGTEFRLTIGGKEQVFTHDQLADHIGKSHDYTRKMQELSTVGTQVANAQAALNDLLPVVIPYMERLIAEGEASFGGGQPDWRKLAETDPGGYISQRAAWDAAQQERANLDRIRQVQGKEAADAFNARKQAGHAQLVKELPGWADDGKRQRMISEIMGWATKQGYPAAELANVVDARHVITLAKAMMFDRMLSGVKTGAPTIPGGQQVGSGRPPPQQSGTLAEAEAAWADRKDIRSAAKLLVARRGRGRPV